MHRRNVTRTLLVGLVVSSLSVALNVPLARAASQVPLKRMQQALAAMHSYRQVMVTRSADAPSSSRSTIIGTRTGKAWRYYDMTTTPFGATELVYSNARYCLRFNHQGPWDCKDIPAQITALLTDSSLNALFKPFGGGATSLGTRLIQRQTCSGYRFALSTALQVRGTLWIAVSTHLPVEEDLVAPVSSGAGRATAEIQSTITWSNWNDPSLAIPAIPAA